MLNRWLSVLCIVAFVLSAVYLHLAIELSKKKAPPLPFSLPVSRRFRKS